MNYVDPLTTCVPNARWKYGEACHLFGGNAADLHALARELGLRREWFQEKETPRRSHYDLTRAKRALAVKLGARELTREEAVAFWRGEVADKDQMTLL